MADEKGELVLAAAEGLQKTTGLTIRVELTSRLVGTDGEITIARGSRHWRFQAETMVQPTVAKLGLRAMHSRRERAEGILVTDFAPTSLADYLRQTDTQFVDTAGNAYINHTDLYVFVKGNKRPAVEPRGESNRAFTRTGMRVIFAFLTSQGLENRTFREIAHDARVALSTVSGVVRGLKAESYLVDMENNNRRLRLRQSLINEWVAGYPRGLRPKVFIGRYAAPNADWWTDLTPGVEGAWWGGEIAASRLTKNFTAESATLYVQGGPGELIGRHALKKDPRGNVEILNSFWNVRTAGQHPSLVHPLLVYADLIASADQRVLPAAKLIRENELPLHPGED